ncbi:MAG TPA: molybdate ABC transporter substrate-binding protein [Methylomirabilota bacterium]|jgi:molybdate transport system substrate-binding protein|nr:molybdate ABC transporter substrate-binding protein [Methylomirabilota bacterium]
MRRIILLALVLVLAAGPAALAQSASPAITVYAAADLDMAFREIKPLFEKAAGTRVTLVMGSTGNLAKQIEHGAPADVFFAANESFIDDLQAAGAVIPQTRALYAQGRLVLATPTKSAVAVRELAELLKPEVRRVAIANPAHAPYGRAAREALESAGMWERLKPKLVYGENIRHTLQFVETGAVEAGIIALSVAGVPDVRYVPIDPKLHKPLNQVAAVVKRSARPELGVAFIQFLNGSEGRPIMKRYGFLLPGEF